MTDTLRTGYGRWLLPIVLAAVMMLASKGEPRCSLPDPKAPDSWGMNPTVGGLP
jgi:hypothetical protein